MIKYLGSKRLLLPRIAAAFAALPERGPVLDLFSGTSRVGHALKALGFEVTANDHNTYAWHLAGCYVAADGPAVEDRARRALAELEAAPPIEGWFSETFAEKARYLRPENAARVAGMRLAIDELAPPGDPLRHVLLTALLEAADRVDSTVGVQMAWLKQWARRAHKPVQLRLPALLPGPGHAWQREAADAAAAFTGAAAYLDPPYNQHSYLGNYHLWETLCRWDQPETYGKAQKRSDVRTRKSPFNSKTGIDRAMAELLDRLDVPVLVLSFSDEGYLSRQELEGMLAGRGAVEVVEIPHPRYVGAKIGIYSPGGERVGEVGHLRNTERLYCVAPSAALARSMAQAAASAAG